MCTSLKSNAQHIPYGNRLPCLTMLKNMAWVFCTAQVILPPSNVKDLLSSLFMISYSWNPETTRTNHCTRIWDGCTDVMTFRASSINAKKLSPYPNSNTKEYITGSVSP